MTFSPQFERIWLESKKRLPEYVARKPANLQLRSQYSIRFYDWAKKDVEVGTKALEAIKEAEAFVERSDERWWSAELLRLRGVFLANLGADGSQIEASFLAALTTAKQQKSVSLEKRAEGSYAEYRRQKTSALRRHGVRLPL